MESGDRRHRRLRRRASRAAARHGALRLDHAVRLFRQLPLPVAQIRRNSARRGSCFFNHRSLPMTTMTAVVFKGRGRIAIEEVPKPRPRAGEALIRITTTTICGTDVHIVRGEYPVKPGLVLGHEPVGVITELGPGLDDLYAVGQRVIVGAITPCGQCFYCLNGSHSQCGGALGGWKFGNTINGAWAEFLLVPDARANLAPIPRG